MLTFSTWLYAIVSTATLVGYLTDPPGGELHLQMVGVLYFAMWAGPFVLVALLAHLNMLRMRERNQR